MWWVCGLMYLLYSKSYFPSVIYAFILKRNTQNPLAESEMTEFKSRERLERVQIELITFS